MKKGAVFFGCAIAVLAVGAFAAETGPLTELTIKGLHFRQIGPANIGGRITDIAVDPKESTTIYAAEGTGGLYKSTNDGVTWENIFSKEAVASVGAVTVAPTKADDVWVGTGEVNTRNSVAWGDGVYVSHDGGTKWKRTGLETSRSIGRIIVDPADPKTVWVAALGDPFAAGGERGVYVTRDGGATWTASLKTDADTGAVDLAMDPHNPNTLYAAMYARRRNGFSFRQGSASDGIYRTTDGGKSWERLKSGLPDRLQRIGLAVAPSNSRIVYAVLASAVYGTQDIDDSENKAGGVFRSDDGGSTWRRMSGYDPRPFYFSQIRVDPNDTNRVYELNYDLGVSTDGGKTFKASSFDNVHSDWHAMWIDPRNSKRILVGTDGGYYATADRGETWRAAHNMASGEFYTVTYDYAEPYDVCGGLQDNNSWCGPHATHDRQGITDSDWIIVGGGDGFYCQIDPKEPWVVWVESQGGNAYRLDLRTGKRTPLKPLPVEGTRSYRFNWNSPLALDRFDHSVAYLGGNRLFRYTKEGEHWEAISPDLSKDRQGTTDTAGSAAENYGTIVTFSQSPMDRHLIWAGTDDGNVQLTRDGGATWTNLTAHLPADVRDEWVARIEASHFVAGRAYVAINGHYNDDFRPHVFVTDDFGQTWTPLAAGLPADGPAKVVREDLRNPNLLFAGTEFALYVSIDRGAHWLHVTNGLPTVAVDDIQIHPRDRDLIVATHGAAIWVLDDIAALEGLSPEVLDQPVALFDVRPAYEYFTVRTQETSDDEFAAKNPPAGLLISYYIKSYTGEPVSISIKDAAKKVVIKLDGTDHPGVNRINWDLHPKLEGTNVPRTSVQAPFVPPGTYTVELKYGSTTLNKQATVARYDPAWAGRRMH